MACYLVSACLCGERCRYDGGAFDLPVLRRAAQAGIVLPFCPEQAGGLSTPRPPCECCGGRVLTADGCDCTAEYRRGAELALALCRQHGLTAAILKENSPSCGVTHIYDGTHSGVKIPGQGIAAALLAEAGIRLFTEQALPPELSGR